MVGKLKRAAGVSLVAAAGAAGWVARAGRRYGLGVAGAGCVVVGASLAHPVAGWLAAGVLLLMLDRKVP